MTESTSAPMVVRTERGLTIAGTRTTLYQVTDYLQAGWPHELIQGWLSLTAEQLAEAMEYISAHRSEFDQEYQQVLRHADENRRYWAERNRRPTADSAARPSAAVENAARAKLDAWKAERGLK